MSNPFEAVLRPQRGKPLRCAVRSRSPSAPKPHRQRSIATEVLIEYEENSKNEATKSVSVSTTGEAASKPKSLRSRRRVRVRSRAHLLGSEASNSKPSLDCEVSPATMSLRKRNPKLRTQARSGFALGATATMHRNRSPIARGEFCDDMTGIRWRSCDRCPARTHSVHEDCC